MKTETELIAEINASLDDIELYRSSLTLLKTQGFNSAAYEIDSSAGPTILHVVQTPLPEQIYQNVPAKIHALSDFLLECSEIPTAQVLSYGHFVQSGYYILQKKCPGKTPGTQDIVDGEIVHSFNHSDLTNELDDLHAILSRLHKISVCSQFGHITVNEKGSLCAPYNSWREFIITDKERWLKSLLTAKKSSEQYLEKVKTASLRASDIEERYEDVLDWSTPCLVHGDMVNPGNFLVQNGHVTTLLDFEWSVSGDPAWEFAFTPQFPTNSYFRVSGEIPSIFNRRKRVYRFYWLLWGANVHAHNTDTFFRDWLLDKCLECADSLI